MKKILLLTLFLTTLAIGKEAQASTNMIHVVKSGDSLWKIAVENEIGLKEIIEANPNIQDPSLIYPGEKISVPSKNVVDTSIQNDILKLVNVERSKQGLKPLRINWELSRVAKAKAADMADEGYFSHTSPTYGTPFDMMKHYGISYKTAGENIAAGQKTAEQVMKAWMNSAGHKANILNANYTELGVGFATGGAYKTYWVQQFIGK